MGRPRLIIVVRHAQSEGNRNRAIHQTVPDHRVKLTSDGWTQAEAAGARLRDMLHPDDTIQVYTSPYRRTRETTEGMLRSLTGDDPSPSPFPRHTVKVFEEPRLREQDFGNFQPCSAAMERMWQERADYGHFFYRIPNGESAADAYDRISGFNETLWRSFQDDEFPSVCVLVTHGLMTRVFLMRWFHWTVEYFEDLRNVNHCEFVVMKRSEDSGKYVLHNELRTWSELKRRAEDERRAKGLPPPEERKHAETKQWGGCAEGCTHEHDEYPKRPKRQNTHESPDQSRSAAAAPPPPAPSDADATKPAPPRSAAFRAEEDSEAFPHDGDAAAAASQPLRVSQAPSHARVASQTDPGRGSPPQHPGPHWLRAGRDFGGSESGANTPAAGAAGDAAADDYGFPVVGARRAATRRRSTLEAGWVAQSGMGTGSRADALGDQTDDDDEAEEDDIAARESEDRSLRGSVY